MTPRAQLSRGIVSYGVYLPYYRIERRAIGEVLGQQQPPGARAVAAFDEDTTSMGVEAARLALRAAADGVAADALVFSTPEPAYLDKTNAAAVHAALGLPQAVLAFDASGATRSGVGAMRLAVDTNLRTLVVTSDLRSGLPGGVDESEGGDAAAAFLLGAGDDVIAEFVASASSTSEFLDRWRLPGWNASKVWEERFGETEYVPLAQAAVDEVLKLATVDMSDIDHLVVAGLHRRATRRITAGLGLEQTAPDLTQVIGCTGAAELGVGLADVLDRAASGELVLVLSVADGADALLFRTTPAITQYHPAGTVAESVSGDNARVSYGAFLTWRGFLDRDPPRRPEPDSPAAPASARNEVWKFAFNASRCEACGTRHLPPCRVCVHCGAADQMADERLADVRGTITTFTVDRLAFSLNPPTVIAVVDFDGGGRFQCEMTDVDPDRVQVGDRVEMTFRRVYTASNGVHNYFWKARPVRDIPSRMEN